MRACTCGTRLHPSQGSVHYKPERAPRISITSVLGPGVFKYYLLWDIWSLETVRATFNSCEAQFRVHHPRCDCELLLRTSTHCTAEPTIRPGAREEHQIASTETCRGKVRQNQTFGVTIATGLCDCRRPILSSSAFLATSTAGLPGPYPMRAFEKGENPRRGRGSTAGVFPFVTDPNTYGSLNTK